MTAPLSDVRFYFHASAGLLTMMVAAAVAMASVGMPLDRTRPIMVTIAGFAALIMAQYRTAYKTAQGSAAVAATMEGAIGDVRRRLDGLAAAVADLSRREADRAAATPGDVRAADGGREHPAHDEHGERVGGS